MTSTETEIVREAVRVPAYRPNRGGRERRALALLRTLLTKSDYAATVAEARAAWKEKNGSKS